MEGIYTEKYALNKAIEVTEESFIVIDLEDKGRLKKDLMVLGKFYDQDSITYSKVSSDYFLISTNTSQNVYFGKGKIGI